MRLKELDTVKEFLTTSNGRRLGYRRVGQGPVLICHPGGPGFSSLYFGDLAGLGADFTLVLLDPRGTAESDRPTDPRAYLIDDYVDDLDELRAHLRLERMLLLGHSHGGVVAMAYASAHPDRIERLVLSSTLARFAEEQEAAMQAGMEGRAGEPWYADAKAALEAEQAGQFSGDKELAELVFRELPLYFAKYGKGEAAYLDTLRAEIPNGDALRQFNNEIFASFDLRDSLDRILAPTLVITGVDDFITGPICARELASRIAGARSIIVPSSGHMIFVEARDRFRGEVSKFLMAVASGAGKAPN
jgi:pimeloyl-ACP methyl ester carboxylesterase